MISLPPSLAPPQDACALVRERWGRQGGAPQQQQQPEDPLLAALVRLLAQFFATQLR